MENNTQIWIALIAMIGTTLASIITAFVTITTRKEAVATRIEAKDAKQQAVETREETRLMHKSVNSKMDALLETTRQLARLEGMAEQRNINGEKGSPSVGAERRAKIERLKKELDEARREFNVNEDK
jgi:hypothetical protein